MPPDETTPDDGPQDSLWQPAAMTGEAGEPLGTFQADPLSEDMVSDAELVGGARGPGADEPPMIVPVRAYYFSRAEDTLRSIAAQFLHAPRRWDELRALNAASPGVAALGPDSALPVGTALALPGDPLPWGKPDPVYLWTLAEKFLFTAWGREPTPEEVVPFWRGLTSGSQLEAWEFVGPDHLAAAEFVTRAMPEPETSHDPEPDASREPDAAREPEDLQPYADHESAAYQPPAPPTHEPPVPPYESPVPPPSHEPPSYEPPPTPYESPLPPTHEPPVPAAPAPPTHEPAAYQPPPPITQPPYESPVPPTHEPPVPAAPAPGMPDLGPIEPEAPYVEAEAPRMPRFMPSLTGAETAARAPEADVVASSNRSLAGTAIGDAMMLWQLARLRRQRGTRPDAVHPIEESLRRSARVDTLNLIEAAMRHLRAVTVGQLREKPAVLAVRVGTYGFEVLLNRPTQAPEGWKAVSGGYVLELPQGVAAEDLEAAAQGPTLCPALVPVGDTLEGPLLLNIEEIGCLIVSGPGSPSVNLLNAVVGTLGSSPLAGDIRIITVGLDSPAGLPGWERVHSTSFDSPQLEEFLSTAHTGSGASLDVLVVGPGNDLLIQRAGQVTTTPGSRLALVGATSSVAARWPWRIHVGRDHHRRRAPHRLHDGRGPGDGADNVPAVERGPRSLASGPAEVLDDTRPALPHAGPRSGAPRILKLPRRRALALCGALAVLGLMAASCGGSDESGARQAADPSAVSEAPAASSDFMNTRPGAGIAAAGGNPRPCGATTPANSPAAPSPSSSPTWAPTWPSWTRSDSRRSWWRSPASSSTPYTNEVNFNGGIDGRCVKFVPQLWSLADPVGSFTQICTDLPPQRPVFYFTLRVYEATNQCLTISAQIPALGLYASIPAATLASAGDRLYIDDGSVEHILSASMDMALMSEVISADDRIGLLHGTGSSAGMDISESETIIESFGTRHRGHVEHSRGVRGPATAAPREAGTTPGGRPHRRRRDGGAAQPGRPAARDGGPVRADGAVLPRRGQPLQGRRSDRGGGHRGLDRHAPHDPGRGAGGLDPGPGSPTTSSPPPSFWPTSPRGRPRTWYWSARAGPRATRCPISTRDASPCATPPRPRIRSRTGSTPMPGRSSPPHATTWTWPSAPMTRVRGEITAETFAEALHNTQYDTGYGGLITFAPGDQNGAERFRVLQARPECVLNFWGCMRSTTDWMLPASAAGTSTG